MFSFLISPLVVVPMITVVELLFVAVIVLVLVLLYLENRPSRATTFITSSLQALETGLAIWTAGGKQDDSSAHSLARELLKVLLELKKLDLTEHEAKAIVSWFKGLVKGRPNSANPVDKALVLWARYAEDLDDFATSLEDIRWARGRVEKKKAPTTQKEEDRFQKAMKDSETYRKKAPVKELQEEANKLHEATDGMPKETSMTNCPKGQFASTIAFGTGGGLKMSPECCIEIRFSPKLKDTWGDDIQVLADPKNAPMKVSGLKKGRHRGTSRAVWEDFYRDSDDLDEWELPGYSPQFRWVRICNTGSKPFTLKRVKQI